MDKIDSIIFDLDGTLWDTIESCVKSIDVVKEKHEDITNCVTANDVRKAMGKTIDEIVEIYYSYLPKEKAFVYTKEAFETNIKNLLENGGTLYKNTKETIIELSKKYKLYIVSNCIDGYIESFFKTSNLKEYILDYECNGRTGLCKGENIKLIIERNKLNNPIYVGDTENDKEAADIANIPFVYASYGFGKVDKYLYKIEDIIDLLKI